MSQKWMIIKVKNIIDKKEDTIITESCYQIVEMDFKTKKEAVEKRKIYREPQFYIIQSYY